MKGLCRFLSIIAFAFAVTACGGGSGGGAATGTTNSISGTTIAGATLNMSGNATANTTADTSGKYSFSGLANGNYIITPSFIGYTFSPINATISFTGGNYSGVDFGATPNTGGVIFSGLLGGLNSVANTHWTGSSFVEGGSLTYDGSVYYYAGWSDSNGAAASFVYTPQYDVFTMAIGSSSYSIGTCRAVSPANASSPTCSSLGITLNRTAGVITFASTPILSGTNTSTGITATGSLTFPPF